VQRGSGRDRHFLVSLNGSLFRDQRPLRYDNCERVLLLGHCASGNWVTARPQTAAHP
jgi:hypothetical protein